MAMPLRARSPLSRVAPGPRRPSRGLSLVELLIATALGLAVTGIVLFLYLSGVIGHRQASALARMTLDAQMALATLSRDIQMAGHVESHQLLLARGGLPARLGQPQAIARPVFGCESGFADLGAAMGVTACAPGGTSALEVSFEATPDTTPVAEDGADDPGRPTDCLGTRIGATTPDGTSLSLALVSHRYYLDTPAGADGRRSLYCASTAGPTRQPLVEGVAEMQLRYGVAPGWSVDPPDTRRARRYVRADQVGNWSEVVSVRICLLMRSAEAVHPRGEAPRYLGCDGVRQTAPDLHLYRAFHATATVRNRAVW